MCHHGRADAQAIVAHRHVHRQRGGIHLHVQGNVSALCAVLGRVVQQVGGNLGQLEPVTADRQGAGRQHRCEVLMARRKHRLVSRDGRGDDFGHVDFTAREHLLQGA